MVRQARKAGASAAQPGGGTLFTEQVLVVNQKVKAIGSTVGYSVYSGSGQQLGALQEVRRSLRTKMQDTFVPASERRHRFEVVDLDGRVLLAMTRPEMGWWATAKLVIDGPGGAPIGQIVHESFGSAIAHGLLGGLKGLAAGTARRSIGDKLSSAVEGLGKIVHARFDLESGGRRLGSIHAENFEEWDFVVRDSAGVEIARITKTWAGWAKERFTSADNYVVQMHRPLDDPLRSLVIAGALAIDFELKERGGAIWNDTEAFGRRRYR